jgi:hypothetical protein
VYVRRSGALMVERLDPHPLNRFEGEPYQRALSSLI